MRQKIAHFLVGSPDQFTIESQILNGGCILSAVSGVIAFTLNHLTYVRPELDPSALFSIVFGVLAWTLGRRLKHFTACLIFLLSTQLLLLSAAYVANNGILGPMPGFFIVLLPFYICILSGALAILVSSAIFLTITTLYFLESKGYITTVGYTNASSLMNDQYIAFLLGFFIIIIIIMFAKQRFLLEQRNAIAANSAKTKFLVNMSHEIRTPMNAILGMNELALSRSTDEQQKAWLQSSQHAAQHLLSLMEDLLDVSSIDEGKLVIHVQTINLRDLVSGVIDILQPLAQSKKLFLNLHLSENIPNYVKADPVRLRQILVNLINNAIKFTDKGGVTISIAKGNAALNFSIQDTGLGIPSKEHKKIFEVFTQAENIDALRHKGFGLGLTISKQLIEKMGGSLHLKSQLGIGSTFFFSLPYTAANEIKSVTGDALTILLVEDNEINIEVARIFLLKNNFTVDVAVNGQKALEFLAKRKYSAALMDLEMPVMGGLEATRALRAGKAGTLNQYTPVIALTAHALSEYHKKSLEAGMNGFLTKPIDGALLINEVKRAIEEKMNP